MSNRLDKDREVKLEPLRMQTALEALAKLGFKPKHDDKKIEFDYNGNLVTFFPYSGWHTGKGIKDGRGLQNLLMQLK